MGAGRGGGDSDVKSAQCPFDTVDDALKISQYIVVPEPEYPETSGFQPNRPSRVSLRAVLATVDLDDQSRGETDEIGNVGANRRLAPKARIQNLPAPDRALERPLRIGHARAKRARKLCLAFGARWRCHTTTYEWQSTRLGSGTPSQPSPVKGEGSPFVPARCYPRPLDGGGSGWGWLQASRKPWTGRSGHPLPPGRGNQICGRTKRHPSPRWGEGGEGEARAG